MNPDDRPRRTAEVGRYLAGQGFKGVRLVKGPAYFCFEGDPTEDWADHTVEIPLPERHDLRPVAPHVQGDEREPGEPEKHAAL
ncbi:MAG: hypothetical protein NTX87_02845 [Planctomycetota bacterium]|nr:hypothetical protein [Planctomycetota bacterium]